MQFHFAFPQILAATVQPANAPAGAEGIGAGTLAVIFLAGIFATVMANWLTSFMLTKETATLRRAILLPIFSFLAGLGVVLVTGIIGAFMYMGEASTAMFALLAISTLIAFVVVAIRVPMSLYQIGALRAIAFLIIAGVIAGTLAGSADFLIIGPAAMADLSARNAGGLQQLQGQLQLQKLQRQRQAARPTPEPVITRESLQERQAALVQRYNQLETRRKYLPQNDSKAAADYARDKAAYEQDLAELKADAARLQAPH